MGNKFTASRLGGISKSSIRKIFDKAPEGSINMGLGELQFPTPKKIIRYAQNILENGYVPYTANAGDPELIESILKYYNNIENIDVCVTIGAEEAAFISILGYVEEGDEVLIADPGFVAYESIVNISGGKVIKFDLDPENNFKIDFKDFASKITPKTKMIVISNPSNPLGISLRQDEIDFLINVSQKNDLLLLVDEIYRDLYHSHRSDTFLGKYRNVIVVSGLSKSHCMTGWRIGWVVAEKNLIAPMIDLHQYNCTCVPYLSQKTAVYALSEDGLLENNIIRKYLTVNYNYITDKFSRFLPEIKFIESDVSPYFFIRSLAEEQIVIDSLSKAGIICTPGSAFGDNSLNWIRLSYGLNIDILEKAVDRIISVLGKIH